MIKLNRILLVLLAILVLVASDDSGSGSIAPDYGSPTDDYIYDDDSNVGSLDSDEEDDDPLDEEYYGMGSGSGDDGDSFTVDLSKHATANPILILILSLLSVCGLVLRR